MLVKLLDAEDTLSVQVHPDDVYASLNEYGELGKTEMWYIIDAKPGAELITASERESTGKISGMVFMKEAWKNI